MRVVVLALVAAASVGCGGSPAGLFRQYEYEEEMYLRLDGSATVYVNASILALNALRGTSFDAKRGARVDRDAVRQYFTSPVTRVMRVSASRRRGRQYVHVRIEADDVRKLHAAAPFSWSTYRLADERGLVVYEQKVGAAAPVASGGADEASWDDDLTAFRIHVPGVVEYHNAGRDNLRRGNIVVWEQPLAERLRGVPLALEVRMQPQSILYRTLILFATMFAAVAMLFAGVVWWVVRKGRKS